jgi:hypothetical protein
MASQKSSKSIRATVSGTDKVWQNMSRSQRVSKRVGQLGRREAKRGVPGGVPLLTSCRKRGGQVQPAMSRCVGKGPGGAHAKGHGSHEGSVSRIEEHHPQGAACTTGPRRGATGAPGGAVMGLSENDGLQLCRPYY